jgi:hypothetical protein
MRSITFRPKASPTPAPAPIPAGHQGARVEITQRPALALNGWFGVVVLALCAGGFVLLTNGGSAWIWLPILVFVIVVASLVVVPPGQTSVIQFFGTYVGT